MREILFRGKGTINNEWIYGDLLYYADTAQIWQDSDLGKYAVSVVPETVGQYTGLTDKNDTKIFEGDIVRHYFKLSIPGEETATDRGVIKWDCRECFFFRTSLDGKDKTVSANCVYEVIGNIYDNPELIGGGENG